MATIRCLFIVCLLWPGSIPVFAASPEIARFTSGGRQVSYEIFGAGNHGPLLIMLHAAGGPDVARYRDRADNFAAHGYIVLSLHYFDATDSEKLSDNNYAAWEQAVSDLVDHCRRHPGWSGRKIGLIGFSLGAMVALAAGSQAVPVNAVAEWYGSLPDPFLEKRKTMPPLLILHGEQDAVVQVVNARQLLSLCQTEHWTCESHFYPDQGHGFQGSAVEDAEKRTLDFFARKLQ
jgi:dienelactone hydrolase